ncbi:hypothetical protein LTR10_017018 [Elasticomyces elasticus]|uniref:Uncharacterized protein n=1 Tax=Exophiala sideris TaxID=1016849 RepID=A0ABR0IZG4_9EURO|nr:hypothetical protein LTR10_017018 [Elasticomyces elasticus]KAK5023027.1 hypothetical protein LTS07_009520 [Exophiala sideris]KAK5026752.1 hypothetical protein LTR13_009792 [Exophiala sideris]KAK5052405.1 hypothetical protein LTR69_009743 [Exophiala sideris]KAK5178190.1 hypothetical protein LTR44_009274 [Eurotiomycetes sp. CCFEE 6388]
MASLLSSNPMLGEELVEDITRKAAGVFLWVRLVVRSLWQGLMNGDSLKDLQKRLQEIPAEVEEFYHTMLDKMSPMYRRDAARLFSILAHATEKWLLPVSLLQLSFAMDETLETAVKKSTKSIQLEEKSK